MSVTLDRNIFNQIGLDSGSLTMLGVVVHSFSSPGRYRGVLYHDGKAESVFYIESDPNSAASSVNIDLATLDQPGAEKCGCGAPNHEPGKHFAVNPRGYAVFHVSKGPGGYAVRVDRAEEQARMKFDTRELGEGDLFSAIIIRPGTYSVTNLMTKAKGEIIVPYPKMGEAAYHPPNPLKIECTKSGFEPEKIHASPGQGQIYSFKTPSRIKIELLKPDDDHGARHPTMPSGWRKAPVPKRSAKA